MAASIVGVKGIDDGKPQDLFNFSPNNISTHASTRNKDLTRRRLSMAGFDHFMQFHRAEPKSSFQPGTTSIAEEEPQDAELKLTKRRQGPSKSFSGIKPANMHSLRASYQAVKANAKQKFQTATSSKRRAASHETHERPTLQRPRSLFGLRPSTASIFSKTIDEESAATSPPASTPPSNNNDNNNNNNHTAAWTQLSGAAARQSARQFGKMPIAARSRDDSAFGEHRMRSSDHRESGISITAEIENLHIGDTTWRESVPDVPRYDPTQYLPTEVASLVLSFLEMKELVVCERVSRKWRELSRDPCLRRQRFMRSWTTSTQDSILGAPVGGLGIGRPKTLHQDWTQMHRARKALQRRWREGPNHPHVVATYLTGHTDSVYCVQFDEDKVITGSRDRTFRVWDVKSGELRLTVGIPFAIDNDRRHDGRIRTQESLPGPMQVINRPVGLQGQYMIPNFYHNASILCLQFDEELLVTGSSDHTLIMWNVKTFQPIRRLFQHSAGVLDIAFDEVKIISCSKDGTICVWDRQNGQLLTVLAGHRGPVNAVQMHGNQIVTASGEGCAKLWQLREHDLGTELAEINGRCIKEFRSKDRGLACVEFSADGRFVMAGGNDKVIYKFDSRTGATVELYKGHKGLVRSLYLDQPNGRIITGSYDNELKCWDYESNTGNAGLGTECWGLAKWATSWILSAKSDYRRLITTSQDGRALLLDFGVGIEGVDLLEGR